MPPPQQVMPMSARTIAALLLVLAVPAAHANWKTHVSPADSSLDPGRASIQYNPLDGDIPTFRAALANLREDGHLDQLKVITIHGAVLEPSFQEDLIETLEMHVPQEFAAARASRGHGPDPAMDALRDVFNDVVLELPMVRRLEADLREEGLTINRVSHEKLWLRERDGDFVIMVMLWLGVESV